MFFFDKFLMFEKNPDVQLVFKNSEFKIIGELFKECNTFQDGLISMYHNLSRIYFENKDFRDQDGYLYCLSHEVYAHWGKNVYKLGFTGDLDKRSRGYHTYYLGPIFINVKTEKIKHCRLAEKILFQLLSNYRCNNKQEFFMCDLEIIKNKMGEVEKAMNTMTVQTIIQKYVQFGKYNICTKYDRMFQKFFGRFLSIPNIDKLTGCKYLDTLTVSIIDTPQYWDKFMTIISSLNTSKIIEYDKSILDSKRKSLIITLANKMNLCNIDDAIMKQHDFHDIFTSHSAFKAYLSFVMLIKKKDALDDMINDGKMTSYRTAVQCILDKILFCHRIETILNIGIMEVVLDSERLKMVVEGKDIVSDAIVALYKKIFPGVKWASKLVYWSDYYKLLGNCYLNLVKGIFVIGTKQKSVKNVRSFVINSVTVDDVLIKKFLRLYKYHYGSYASVDKDFAKRFDIEIPVENEKIDPSVYLF